MILLFILSFTYVASSVNFSIGLFKLLGKDDPRTKFSGNAGATNVYRQAGLFWAAAVLMLDMGRAMLVCYLALTLLDPAYVTLPGLVLILGNRFPCFHGFKGGKGVANYLGFTLLLSPAAAVISALAWGGVFLLYRKPFLSSFAMVLVLGAGTIMVCRNSGLAVAIACLTVLLIFMNHKQNILEFLKTRTK